MIEDELVEVTQADRDAAASLNEVALGYTKGGSYSDGYWIKNGQFDDNKFVQAFARHRVSAINPVRVREEERERIVEWLRGKELEARALPVIEEEAGIIADLADAIERGDHSPTR